MKKCIYCDNTADFGIFCHTCDAVGTIAVHIKAYHPSRIKEVITTWYEKEIFTSQQLIDLAIQRKASKLRILAIAIREQEHKADNARVKGKTVMQRAMDYCWKGIHEKKVETKEVTEAMEEAMGVVK